MTGPDHYKAAEKLLEQASSMLSTNVAPEERTELVVRQAVMVMRGAAHAVLALAAATGLSAHLDSLDTQTWRDVASGPRLPGAPPPMQRDFPL
jgi:hypothetical protein